MALLLLLSLLPSSGDSGACHCPACFAACDGACSQALRSACPPERLGNQSNPLPRCEACVAAHAAGLTAAGCGRVE